MFSKTLINTKNKNKNPPVSTWFLFVEIRERGTVKDVQVEIARALPEESMEVTRVQRQKTRPRSQSSIRSYRGCKRHVVSVSESGQVFQGSPK